jgi:hypothetical protein
VIGHGACSSGASLLVGAERATSRLASRAPRVERADEPLMAMAAVDNELPLAFSGLVIAVDLAGLLGSDTVPPLPAPTLLLRAVVAGAVVVVVKSFSMPSSTEARRLCLAAGSRRYTTQENHA